MVNEREGAKQPTDEMVSSLIGVHLHDSISARQDTRERRNAIEGKTYQISRNQINPGTHLEPRTHSMELAGRPGSPKYHRKHPEK
ncbi:hypothetical protein JTB14_005169 [Gonioctena quinquepunctata]|nr:hypothetical protein JTB14_005169 [Gonioctena quinquepunctata]